MRVGIFADTHDHLDNIRLAVAEFNRRGCEVVIFAGDLVSTFAIPPLRKLNCRMIASFGDNEGNKVGIRGGMTIIGEIGDPPFCFRLGDGTRVLLTHQRELIRGAVDGADLIVYAHTHKPRIHRDEADRLWINPGETSGWTYGKPSIVILDTDPMDAEIVWLKDDSASR
ncbi:MAG: YfcE family phosphodiesterase [Planctomycetota bacterium]|nr:YfcE family phosphodiesterase [Planctomycetota bacterium]